MAFIRTQYYWKMHTDKWIINGLDLIKWNKPCLRLKQMLVFDFLLPSEWHYKVTSAQFETSTIALAYIIYFYCIWDITPLPLKCMLVSTWQCYFLNSLFEIVLNDIILDDLSISIMNSLYITLAEHI